VAIVSTHAGLEAPRRRAGGVWLRAGVGWSCVTGARCRPAIREAGPARQRCL